MKTTTYNELVLFDFYRKEIPTDKKEQIAREYLNLSLPPKQEIETISIENGIVTVTIKPREAKKEKKMSKRSKLEYIEDIEEV